VTRNTSAGRPAFSKAFCSRCAVSYEKMREEPLTVAVKNRLTGVCGDGFRITELPARSRWDFPCENYDYAHLR
jgi:hypothetical protein